MQTASQQTLLVKSWRAILNTMEKSFTRGTYSVSLAFKRHRQDGFFELTNRVTTSFTSVRNEANRVGPM